MMNAVGAHVKPSKAKRMIVALTILFVALSTLVYALEVSDLEFRDSYGQLKLRGAGIKRFFFIQVVAVGLYLQSGMDSQAILDDIPKSLEVIYLQNIPSIELQLATTQGIRRNVTPADFKKIEKRIEQINTYYPSVHKKDRIRVTYIPGQGTTVEHNGVVKGIVEGADFGKAFFSIWFGKRPVDPLMKVVLLGQN